MKNEIIRIKPEKTKSGLPALWEAGGGCTNTGDARIICNRNGQPKKPIYIRRSGHLSNREHALLVIEEGDYVIYASHHRRDYLIRIYKIVNIEQEHAFTELKYEFSKGEWDQSPPEFLQNAINAATEKASCYHCKEPHFVAK